MGNFFDLLKSQLKGRKVSTYSEAVKLQTQISATILGNKKAAWSGPLAKFWEKEVTPLEKGGLLADPSDIADVWDEVADGLEDASSEDAMAIIDWASVFLLILKVLSEYLQGA